LADPGSERADTGPPRIVAFGDAALLVELGHSIDLETNLRAHALVARVAALRAGAGTATPWGVPVAGYAAVLVPFDPARSSAAEAEAALQPLVTEVLSGDVPPDQELPLVTVPVHYGGQDGPDLAEVAEATGLTPAQVVERHAAQTYRVFLLGFAPGFAYLGTLPAELEVPRRPSPRPRVPPGSVAIAGRQTCVYPSATPGGWQLIGRTDLRVWDPRRTPPGTFRPGQPVRFVPRPA
jgi:KipI family sensor histidine kinase inhibitor